MKITYTPNPLTTIVELDAQEQEIFRLKIKIAELESDMHSAYFYLQEGKTWYSVEDAREELDPEYIMGDGENGLDARIQKLFDCFLGDLRSTHVGDCTCVPCSCTKCHAEGILGIDTTPGLGKYEGKVIYQAFNYKDGEEWKSRSLPEVLELLQTRQPSADWAGSEEYVPRWKAEQERAYQWLLNYSNTHFGKPSLS